MTHLWHELARGLREDTRLHTPSRSEEPVSGAALFALYESMNAQASA